MCGSRGRLCTYIGVRPDMKLFSINNEWIPVSNNDEMIAYAYAGLEIIAYQSGDSISALTE